MEQPQQDNNNVVAGTYTATVTDANGRTATRDYTVTEPTQLVASCSGTAVSCKNGNDGHKRNSNSWYSTIHIPVVKWSNYSKQ
nr:hypothetical protein [Bacteroidota bacterium]